MKLSLVSLTLQSAIYGRTDRNFGRCQESYFWQGTFSRTLFEGTVLCCLLIKSNLERLKQQIFGTDFLVMIFLKI